MRNINKVKQQLKQAHIYNLAHKSATKFLTESTKNMNLMLNVLVLNKCNILKTAHQFGFTYQSLYNALNYKKPNGRDLIKEAKDELISQKEISYVRLEEDSVELLSTKMDINKKLYAFLFDIIQDYDNIEKKWGKSFLYKVFISRGGQKLFMQIITNECVKGSIFDNIIKMSRPNGDVKKEDTEKVEDRISEKIYFDPNDPKYKRVTSAEVLEKVENAKELEDKTEENIANINEE